MFKQTRDFKGKLKITYFFRADRNNFIKPHTIFIATSNWVPPDKRTYLLGCIPNCVTKLEKLNDLGEKSYLTIE